MNINIRDILFACILGFLIASGVRAATYLYSGEEVSYDNTNSHLISTNVQGALDELYTKCNNSTNNQPSNYTCTQKTNIKCKRATILHTEICTNSSTAQFCQGTGYALNDIITYGNTEMVEGVLTPGDAFDCDVNGDGIFDFESERFYYISDYFDTERKKFSDAIAVLVYYSNTTSGVASTSDVAYDSNGENWNGPVTAMQELPTTTQWNNISLYKSTRQILTNNNKTSNDGGTLPSSFSYNGYSARLLTYQEVHHGCFNRIYSIGSTGALEKNCIFLFENTNYADSSIATYGSWGETTADLGMYRAIAFAWDSSFRRFTDSYNYVDEIDTHGVRPVIEVPKDQILY